MVENGFNEDYVDDLICHTRGFLFACANLGVVENEPWTMVDLFRIMGILALEDLSRHEKLVGTKVTDIDSSLDELLKQCANDVNTPLSKGILEYIQPWVHVLSEVRQNEKTGKYLMACVTIKYDGDKDIKVHYIPKFPE
jgi:hypothetical protein